MKLFLLGLASVVCLIWFSSYLKEQRLRRMWRQCKSDAARIVAGVREQYPGCGSAVNALTLATDLQQATSAYKNISFEDFQDALDAVEPAKCPMMAMTENENELGSTEWARNVDSFDAPAGARGVADGQAVVAGDVTNHAANIRKIGNIAQGHREVIGAGWIAQHLPRVAGVKNLTARAKMKAAIQIKRKIEVAMCSLDQTALPDAGNYLGAIGAGYLKLVVSANKYASASAFAFGKASDIHAAHASAHVTGATLSGTHNRAMWKTVAAALRVAAQEDGDWTVLCGLTLRQAVTDLTDPTTVTTTASAGGVARAADQVRVLLRNEEDSVLGATVDVIQTDWGRFLIKSTDYIGNTTSTSTGALASWATNTAQRVLAEFIAEPRAGLIIKRGNVYKRWGIPLFSTVIAPDGGGDRIDTKGLVGFGVKNPVLAGVINFSA